LALVFAGICSHAPGIVNRAERVDASRREALYDAYARMARAIRDKSPDVLVVIGAEHFGNFFMNNMPAFAMGMADYYEGPIEDEGWLRIKRRRIAGNRDLSQRLIARVMDEVDVAYCEEWKLDHAIMVPLHFLTPDYRLPIVPANINCQGPPLTPLHRAYRFGEALRRAADAVPESIAIIGTGGISHWPATPNSGKINEAWDRDFLTRWAGGDTAAMLSYTDADTYRDAGQGGFEIRTFIAIAGVAPGGKGQIWHYDAISPFAVGCTVGVMNLA
jgi:aromatic ring-opening dioxygenase catalytic subunit (LigB family)